jgi:hypothetical protein
MTPTRLLALAAAFLGLLGGLGSAAGCGGGDDKPAAKESQKRLAAERAQKARRALRARERRARARARARRRRRREAALRQQATTPPPTPPTTTTTTAPPQQAPSTGGTPSVDSPEGQKLLEQDPQCKDVPPPPPNYHGPVQC